MLAETKTWMAGHRRAEATPSFGRLCPAMTGKQERQSNFMFLIGQYDSPFVRRVAIAMRLYGIAFEHRPWSTFGDADKIAPYNPLRRVPTLVLDSGEALLESTAILDYLDETVGPDKAMLAPRGEVRRKQLRTCALATGLGDKAVSLLYERVLRKERLELWIERCQAQISGVLDLLEKERAAVKTPYLFGERIGHADVAVACVVRFTGEAHTALFDAARYPALAAHSARCEALPPFAEIVQPLAPPSGD
jgi:glutathione S-transferase